MAGASRSDVAQLTHRRVQEEEGMEILGQVLDELTPETFQQGMKKLREINIRSEGHLRAVVEMVTERAIAEPKLSEVYANLCRCMLGLKVPTAGKPGVTVNFRKLLLNCCKTEFERPLVVEQDQQKHLEEGLEKTQEEVQQRSLGIVKLIGELFKLNVVSEGIIHDCIAKLLKKSKSLVTDHFNPLWSLCVLLCTTGKTLDMGKAKPRMDQYFNQMKKVIKERKTSNRICLMLQDVVDLRESNWIPRHSDPGPQTIRQICMQAIEGNLDKPFPFEKGVGGKKELLPSCQATQHPETQDSMTVLEEEDNCAGPETKSSDSVEKGSARTQKQKFTAFFGGGKNEDAELFGRVYCILDELTPQTFEPLMRQVSRMPINSELKVPKEDNWRVSVNFRKLLLNRCQREFEDNKTEKQNEMGTDYEEKEQDEAGATGLRRSLGNIKFIGELFKTKMLNEPIIHDCIVELFNTSQEECLCVLLLTVGKEIDFEIAKPRMDQYFDQMKKILKEKNMSVNTQSMLQAVVDLRERHWVPQPTDLSLDSIIDQICQEKETTRELQENTEELKKNTKELPTSTEANTEELQENPEELLKNTEGHG
ncbi:eukaryotic translation initiation factor 4 gamma 1-like isoform X2 [Sardina pilchardus]|uniref:eukaryotic translation initiation factor 4 gamma 1-like isoform X2 n=1 Tax=Sardina pilchardus TaxID=27697 RepID=UPI002E0E5123